jgi:hypothetical protein
VMAFSRFEQGFYSEMAMGHQYSVIKMRFGTRRFRVSEIAFRS